MHTHPALHAYSIHPPLPHNRLQSDAGIPGLSPGEPTLRYFAERRQQLKLLNAALLAVLSLAARAVDAASTALIGVPAGCISILLLVSTAALGTRQVGWWGVGGGCGRDSRALDSALQRMAVSGSAVCIPAFYE